MNIKFEMCYFNVPKVHVRYCRHFVSVVIRTLLNCVHRNPYPFKMNIKFEMCYFNVPKVHVRLIVVNLCPS